MGNSKVHQLCDRFSVNSELKYKLAEALAKRKETFDGDISVLQTILETARNPPGLLSVKLREMRDGTFVTATATDQSSNSSNTGGGAVSSDAPAAKKEVDPMEADVDTLVAYYKFDERLKSRILQALSKRPATYK